jgi:DNA-directed RNA polymerase specialized sigma24 family protein
MSETNLLLPFPSTQWSMVARAGASDSVLRRALDALLRRYVPALRSYLLANHRVSPDRADDLLQGFLADKVLEQDIIRHADQTRGKFRTFLMTALNHYTISLFRKEQAGRRSPTGLEPLDGENALAQPAPSAPDTFDVAWARQVLNLAIERTREECEAGGRGDLWAVFEGRVLMPTLRHAEPVPLAELVGRLGVSAEQVSSLLTTAKRMYARNLRFVVGEYAGGEEDVEGEIRWLKTILARSHA